MNFGFLVLLLEFSSPAVKQQFWMWFIDTGESSFITDSYLEVIGENAGIKKTSNAVF